MSDSSLVRNVARRFSVLLDDPAFAFNAAHFVAFPLPDADKTGKTDKNRENIAAIYKNWIGEPIHGHDFRLSARIEGPRDAAGCVVDFLAARKALVDVAKRGDRRLFLARRAPCVEYVETLPNPEKPVGEVEIRWNGAPGPRRWVYPRDAVFWLDADVASTEEIAARALDDWIESLVEANALAFPTSEYRFALRLQEAPGASVEVVFDPFIRQN